MMLSVDQWTWKTKFNVIIVINFSTIIIIRSYQAPSSPSPQMNPRMCSSSLSFLTADCCCWLVVCGLTSLWFWFYSSASSCSYFSCFLPFSRKILIDEHCNISPQAATCCLEWQAVGWVPSFPFFPLKSCQCLFNAVQRAALTRWYVISSQSKKLMTYHGSLQKLLHLRMG